MSAYNEILYGSKVIDEARRYAAAVLANEFIGGVQSAMASSGQGPWIPSPGGFAKLAKEYEDYLKGDGDSKA